MNEAVASILLLTLQVASAATLVAALPCIALGHLLARRTFVGKDALAAIVSIPLVVPPTAIGIVLLHLFATDGPLGPRALGVDLGVVLTWKGAALASALMSSPLLVRTSQVAFESVDPALESMARTLGYGPVETFLRFTLPMARRGLAGAVILAFTRALGEYGATITLAGSIPGETRTLASAIVSAEQAGDRTGARALLVVAIFAGFSLVYLAESLTRTRDGVRKA